MNDDILSTLVTISGAQAVIAQLQSVRQAQEDVIESANVAQAAGSAAVAAAAAASFASVREYESFERFRRSLQSSLGDMEGARIADDVQRFALEANTATDSLTSFARMWQSMTGRSDMILPMVKSLEDAAIAAGATADETYRIGRALSQIQAVGTVRMQEINQLIDAGAPLAQVKAKLGTDDFAGVSAEDFIGAFQEAMAEVNNKPLLASQQLANTLDTIRLALVPTGQLISIGIAPMVMLLNEAGTLALHINDLTHGAAGLSVIVAGAIFGFRLLKPALMEVIATALQLAHSNRQAMIAAGSGTMGGVGSVLKYVALMGAIQNLMSDPDIRETIKVITESVGAMLQPMLAWAGKIAQFFNEINESLGNWPARLLSVLVIMKAIKDVGIASAVIQIAQTIPAIIANLRTWLSVNMLIRAVEVAKAIAAAAYAAFTGNWAGLAVGLGILALAGIGAYGASQGWFTPDKKTATGAADRPARRNDAENIWYKMQARGMAM